MNLPNRLTLLRVLLVPVMVLCLSFGTRPWNLIGAGVFAAASLTDWFDGRIARKRGLITDFGKFLDPLADKLLVLATMVMLSVQHLLPGWLVVLVLARELALDGLRMIAVQKGQVIAAGQLGKIKTASQMVYLLLILLTSLSATGTWYMWILTAWIALITLWSGTDYFLKAGSVLGDA